MENPKEEIYRGFLIKPVFHYTNGRTDFEVYPDSGKEQGSIFPDETIERIREFIDEKIEMEACEVVTFKSAMLRMNRDTTATITTKEKNDFINALVQRNLER